MLRTASTLLAALSVALPAALPLALCGSATAQQSPDEALRALQEGNRRFAGDRSMAQPIGPGVRRTLARGQSPFAIVVTCADSRVPPEHLFNTGLGELIVVRTAGHVLGAEAIATIEHAVERLNVQLCVVLGHEQCDVIGAAIKQSTEHGHDSDLSPAVLKLLERIEPAVRKARALDVSGMHLQSTCEEEHAHLTVAESIGRSPLLQRYASVGKFRMVAARYHSGGDVEFLPNRPLPKKKDHRAVLNGAVPPGLPPHVALRMLRAGHRRFLGDSRPMPDLTKKRREQLSAGQQPLAIVITDSDSRVSPEHIFDAGIGELFVIRVAGNTMTDETLGSIEFAASQLGASLLVVMGHSRCESLAAAANHPEKQRLTPHQRQLLRRLEPSVAAARSHHSSDVIGEATERNVRRTVNEARSRSALLRMLEADGKFSVLGTTYDVASGDLTWLKIATETHTAKADGHGDDHGENHAHGHDDHHAHADSGHGHDAHSSHDEHSSHDAHGSHDEHGSHETHGSHDAHGSHDVHGHADLPTMDLAAPAGETNAHGSSHGHDHGDAQGHGHSDDHGHSHDGDDSHAHGHDDGHGGHGDGSHEDHEHGDGHGDGHGEEGGHGDGHEGGGMMSFLKNPTIMIGMGGIASLLAAGILVLRRRKS